MKKVTFCFITIVLILTLGGIGLAQGLPSLTESSPAPSPTPATPSIPVPPPPTITSIPVSSPNIFSYADSTCSFNFNYPSAWKPYDEMGDTGTCRAEVDLFEGDYITAAFSVYVENYEPSLASYAISVEEWMLDPKNMPEYNKINEEAITLGGLPAIKRLYSWTKIHQDDNSKVPIKAVDVYLVKDKKGYILEGQVVQDKFDQILPQLEAMFNSFALPDGTTEPSSPPVSEATLTVATTTVETSSSSTEEISFKFCPYCGTPLKPEYKFCPGCGKPIPTQRSAKTPKKIGARNANQINTNYSENLIQTRGFSEENDQFNYPRGTNKSYSKPFKSYKPAFISRGFGSQLVRIFPQKPLIPWAVSKRISFGAYANLFPNSLGRKISSQNLIIRSAYPTNLNFSYLRKLGKQIAFIPNLGTAFRGGAIDQLVSSLKNFGEGIYSPMTVSRAPLITEKTWVLRSGKRGVEEDISMGSFIKRLASKIGTSLVDQTRSSSSLGDIFSALGKGISIEIGVKREAETLPSLTPTSPQNTPAPEALAQGGITLTPPGQPVPSQPGTGGIVLPAPGTPQEPQIIWKQYSLNQAFGRNPLIAGYLEYPSTWLVNLDSFNRNVIFSEDASGLTSLTLFPGIMGQFSSAQDLAQQMAYLLQQQVPDLSMLNQEFKIIPAPGSAIEVTEGKINLQGSYQGTTFRFNIETYLMYTGAYGSAASGMSGMGYVILTQAPQGIFTEKEQKYFNHIILSYKRALGVVK